MPPLFFRVLHISFVRCDRHAMLMYGGFRVSQGFMLKRPIFRPYLGRYASLRERWSGWASSSTRQFAFGARFPCRQIHIPFAGHFFN